MAGLPLNDACVRARSWADVRWWLLDLARECAAESVDDRPPRRLDRVWVLDSGGAKLVDDPVIDRAATSAETLSPRSFLLAVAETARGSSRSSKGPWPLRAEHFLKQLRAEHEPDAASLVGTLEPLTRQRAVVTRGWRVLPIAITTIPPMVMALFLVAFISIMMGQLSRVPLEARIVAEGLSTLDRADRGRTTLPAGDREAIEVALTTRYRATLEDLTTASPPTLLGLIMPKQHRLLADDLLRRRAPGAVPDHVSASPAVAALVKEAADIEPPPWESVVVAVVAVSLFLSAIASLAAALVFRGGLMRLLGLELVTADGRPASRPRVFARMALTWALVMVLPLLRIMSRIVGGVPLVPDPSTSMWPWVAPLLVVVAGAVVAVANPARGIQDRLAGTWIVPR